MTTLIAVRDAEWTDGITVIRLGGTTVTVQILGDVYVTRHGSTEEARLAFAAEIAAEMASSARVAGVLAATEEEADVW